PPTPSNTRSSSVRWPSGPSKTALRGVSEASCQPGAPAALSPTLSRSDSPPSAGCTIATPSPGVRGLLVSTYSNSAGASSPCGLMKKGCGRRSVVNIGRSPSSAYCASGPRRSSPGWTAAGRACTSSGSGGRRSTRPPSPDRPSVQVASAHSATAPSTQVRAPGTSARIIASLARGDGRRPQVAIQVEGDVQPCALGAVAGAPEDLARSQHVEVVDE